MEVTSHSEEFLTNSHVKLTSSNITRSSVVLIYRINCYWKRDKLTKSTLHKEFFTRNGHFFNFKSNLGINLLTTAHWQNPRRGPHWSKKMERQPVLKWRSLGRVFQASDNIHRIVVTKGELFKYGIKQNDECCFCERKDSIDNTFIHCSFSKSFIQKLTVWFNRTNLANYRGAVIWNH